LRKALKPCSSRGCPNLTRERYCVQHKQLNRSYDQRRESSSKRGYDAKWRKARAYFLMMNPYCVKCGELATVVDHIVPHKGNMRLFWDQSNWQPLCASDHGRKTVLQDGGFGNERS
jgi:5-methylcytosine-specific restriction enzyme A